METPIFHLVWGTSLMMVNSRKSEDRISTLSSCVTGTTLLLMVPDGIVAPAEADQPFMWVADVLAPDDVIDRECDYGGASATIPLAANTSGVCARISNCKL